MERKRPKGKKKSFSTVENRFTAFFSLKLDYHNSDAAFSDTFLKVFFSLLARKYASASR